MEVYMKTREQQMMEAADRHADEVCDESCTGAQVAETINDFCAGWRAADSYPNWISVEDELPKCNIVDCGLATYPVLVYREDGFIDISCYDSEVGEWDCVGVVTHWMSLPQPPRKEE